MDKIDKVIDYFRNIKEQAPTNALVHGNIAGTKESGDDPPIRKKKYITGGKGSRKFWLNYLKNK